MTSNDEALADLRHALAASEDRYRRLAEAMPQLVWTLDREGRLDFVNQRWVAYSGLTLEESASERRGEVLHPGDRPEMMRRWREAQATLGPFEVYGRIRRAADGAYRWFHISAAPALEENGELAGWVATASDVEDRIRAETSLTLLADVSDVLARAVDEQRMFQEVAQLAARTIADWCAVYLRGEAGDVRIAALAHADPEKLARAVDAVRRYPVRADDPVAQLIEAGRSVLDPHVGKDVLRASTYDERHFALATQLDLASAIVVPLVIREERAGALVFVRGSESRP
ncbi:MAG TPA: PAS domain S-box protein, partial [Candidatus Elarobacter sp.]|nr:PAS domain S-box protein [Candidatus Elarobacter sp.]